MMKNALHIRSDEKEHGFSIFAGNDQPCQNISSGTKDKNLITGAAL